VGYDRQRAAGHVTECTSRLLSCSSSIRANVRDRLAPELERRRVPSNTEAQADPHIGPARSVRGLRVTFVTTTYPRFDGDHTPGFVADLAERLHADHGIEVTVLAPHAHGLAREEQVRGVTVRRFQYAVRSDRQCLAYGYGIPDNLRRLPRARRQVPGLVGAMGWNVLRMLPKCDLVHAHWIEPGFIASAANTFWRRPLVLSVHSVPEELKWFHRRALGSADRVLFTSRFAMGQVERHRCRFRGEVCHQGIDETRFNARRETGVVRAEMGVPAGALLIVAVARLIPFKGLDVLLKAAPAVLSAGGDTHIAIAGDGPLRVELTALAATIPGGERIHFLGALPRAAVAGLMADADVFVNPGIVDPQGRTETLGIVAAEAMASGVPCVGSRVGGIPEVIDEGVTGLLVEPSRPGDLAEALIALLNDPDRRFMMGRAGRSRAASMFTTSAMARSVAAVYGEILCR
jgi:glycosyltransferase involved in cell wall biosynthesis